MDFLPHLSLHGNAVYCPSRISGLNRGEGQVEEVKSNRQSHKSREAPSCRQIAATKPRPNRSRSAVTPALFRGSLHRHVDRSRHSTTNRSPDISSPRSRARNSLMYLKIWMRWMAQMCVLASVGVGAFVAGHEALAYATTAPRFTVQQISFEPTLHVSQQSLEELLALPPNANIWTINEESLRRRIIAHPWIEDASVDRVVPDTVHVHVKEHVAVATVLAEELYLINSVGQVFKRVEFGEQNDLPIISGLSAEQLAEASSGKPTQLKRMLDAINLYHAKNRPTLGEIHLRSDGAITMYVGDLPSQIELGRMDVKQAMRRFDDLRTRLGSAASRLSVVHLDGRTQSNGGFRVTARFAHQHDEQSLFFGRSIEPQPKNSPSPMLTSRERRKSWRNYHESQQS